MPFAQADSLRYYTFESLSNLPLTHGLFTRHGGVSEDPFAELNVGAAVGDRLDSVNENIEHIFSVLKRPVSTLFDSRLVHGVDALLAEAPRPERLMPAPDADIVLTRNPKVSLFMRIADCVPLLFYDPVQHAVALAHAGWKGTVQRVAAKAVFEMETHFASKASDLIAAIGPSICVQHYEVGQKVIWEVEKAFGEDAAQLLPSLNGSTHFDLFAANQLALEEIGVEQVENAEICTATNTEDWFSHRAEGGKTGRFGVLLALASR